MVISDDRDSEFYQLLPEKENTVLVVLLHWIVIYPQRGTINLCTGWGLFMLVTLLITSTYH